MENKKYNPIKIVKAFCVIQGRNTVATDSLFKWGVSSKKEFARQGLECFVIFPSKRKALAWVAHWRNHEDFTVVQIEIKIPEAN